MHSIPIGLDQPVLASNASMEGLLLHGNVKAGFPSPAQDLGAQRVDLALIADQA